MVAKGVPHWSEEEKEYLTSLVDEYGSGELIAKFQAKARREGWYPRTNRAVRSFCLRNGFSLKSSLNNWNYSQLSELLGVNSCTVRSWVNNGWLESQPLKGCSRTHKVSSRDVFRMAQKYPALVLRCSHEGLRFILGDECFEYVLTFERKTIQNEPKRVYDRKTGLYYNSVRQASIESGSTCFTILRHLHKRLKRKPPRWELAS